MKLNILNVKKAWNWTMHNGTDIASIVHDNLATTLIYPQKNNFVIYMLELPLLQLVMFSYYDHWASIISSQTIFAQTLQ